MCNDCGCGDSTIVPVDVQLNILTVNERDAAHNRSHFDRAGVVAVNLMGSPGAGKTAVLEATAKALGAAHGLAALSGDLATDHDGERLRGAGIESATITTGTGCHLDARLVHAGLHRIAWQSARFLVIENVGNLVCPAVYDLGQHANVVALSVTEGEDKPAKYPVMFHGADLVLLTKVDLLPHLPGWRRDRFDAALRSAMPEPRVIEVSATTGQGIAEWASWLERLAERRPTLGRRGPHERSASSAATSASRFTGLPSTGADDP